MSTAEATVIGKWSRLAPELLAMIFLDVIALHERKPILLLPTDEKHLENEIDTKPLLALSHICRYWRDVALRTPALWTRVHGRRQDQMEAFLERSRPLAGGDWDGPLPDHIASVVEAHGSRLRRLDLSMVPTWDHVAPLLAELQASQLECLTITLPTSGSSERDIGLSWGPLLDDEASSLRALALMPVTNWLPSSTFPHLTHLVLSFDAETPHFQHPFDVLRLLSNVPALAFLHVDFLLYDGPYTGNWQPPSDPIPLRHLRTLVFTACSYKILRIVILHLSLPEDVFIRLQDIDNRLALDGPPAPLPPLPLRPVTSLDVLTQDEKILLVADGSASGLWLEAHHDPEGPGHLPDWVGWLLTLHECLTLSHVTYLHIYIEGWEPFWPAFLAHLPQVSHLAVLFDVSGDEVDYRNGLYDSPTTILCNALGQEAPILCLALHTLIIEWPEGIMSENFDSLPTLAAMLGIRSGAGHAIRHVVVQAPPCPPFNDVQGLDFVQALARAVSPFDLELEVVEKEDTDKGLCAFEMRDVWQVDGEERYWELGDDYKPRYVVSPVQY
ncbi:hypothetical protein LXA43DRAFT_1045353 [Ganoderma leucocontextum]|nr:hypothetical protein LXA43DRAFT_1045353 [Ganoderma leucocontextum]